MSKCTISRPGENASVPVGFVGSTNCFTGDVRVEPVLSAENVSVTNVYFSPGARTNWHYHDGGQFLTITAGKGWICDKGQEPRQIAAGDIIWCPPGTVHWHGADDQSHMVHQAVSHGSVKWYDAVGQNEYAATS